MNDPGQANELPIACTLGAGDFETRMRELTALGRRSLLSIERSSAGPVVLSFQNDPATETELERIVAAEADCCAFLELMITTGDALDLTIDGPEGPAP